MCSGSEVEGMLQERGEGRRKKEGLLDADLQNCVQELGEELVLVENEDRTSCKYWYSEQP